MKRKMTLEEFSKLDRNGRFWTYFFFGQSCVNCKWMQNGVCVNQEHLTLWSVKKGYVVEIKMDNCKEGEDIFPAGSKCTEWELICP